MSSYEYEQGKHSFNHWITIEENPYSIENKVQSIWHNEWEKGWKEAEKLLKKIDK